MNFANETPLGDVLKYVTQATRGPGDDAGLPIYVDPIGLQEAEATLNSTVTLDVVGTPLKVTLARLLAPLHLEYVATEDVVIVSSPRRVDRERKETPAAGGDGSPATAAVLARLREPIPMPFGREVPLDFALRTIEQATRKGHADGIPFLVDAVALKEADRSMGSAVAIELEGVPLRTSLRLMLGQLGLAYTVRDGLVIVGTPGRLDRIRGKSGGATGAAASPKG